MAERRGTREATGRPAQIILLAGIASGVMTTGIQAIAPAIPAIQQDFGLSAAQVGLITSVYLFPSMFSAMLAGMLADRIGMRSVYTGCLVLFGASGAAVMLAGDLTSLLVLRAVQGAAFGAVLSLSVSIIGGIVATGPAAAKAQGQRIIAITGAEAVLPVVGGLIVAVGWRYSFWLQLLALPLALWAWRVLPREVEQRSMSGRARTAAVLRAPAFTGVQVLAAMRFVVKFGVIAYFPVLADSSLGMSAAAIGVALGAHSLLGAIGAWQTKLLARRWGSATVIGGCLVVAAVTLLVMAFTGQAVLMVAALLVFGLQDGIYGVTHNVLVTELAPAAVRSTYVGITGTVRNVGKFLAPMLFSGLTLLVTLPQSFLVTGAISAASVGVAGRVVQVQARLRDGDGRQGDTQGGGAGSTGGA